MQPSGHSQLSLYAVALGLMGTGTEPVQFTTLRIMERQMPNEEITQEQALERRTIAGRPALVFAVRTVRIYGSQFDNEDGTSRQEVIKKLVQGDVLELRREPENRYDTNAISAWIGGEQVGYISKHLAEILAPEVDAGVPMFGLVEAKHQNILGKWNVEVYLFEYE